MADGLLLAGLAVSGLLVVVLMTLADRPTLWRALAGGVLALLAGLGVLVLHGAL